MTAGRLSSPPPRSAGPPMSGGAHGRHATHGAPKELAASYRRERQRAAAVQCHVSAQPQVPQRPSRSRSSAVASRTSSSGMPAMCWQ